MTRAHLISAIAITGLALITAGYAVEGRAEVAAAAVGQPAPDFEVADENGVKHKLSAYRDQAVVLEWTNPDCPFVARHYRTDTMEKLAGALGVKGVTWLAVNSTRYNKPEDTRTWRDAQGFAYPTLQDADGKLGRLYGARTTPHMFVIGPKGVLRYAGAIDDDPHGGVAQPANYVNGAVASVLEGAEPEPGQTQPYGCSVKYAKQP